MSRSGHKYLEQLTDFGIKLGLDKIRFILSKLGEPHNRFPSVLIAGTNGKGSVASFVSSCLKEAGYKVGLYTSPHLVRVEERIQINGKPIGSKIFDSLCLKLKNLCSDLPVEMQPTYFEALTAIAFDYFASQKIDICVCEVGMGGRFDATNVLDSFMEIITPISYDHMQYLGNSLEAIASEKAGIIKKNTVVVSGKQQQQALKVLKRVSRQNNAKAYFFGNDFSAKLVSCEFPRFQKIDFQGSKKLKGVSINLFGRHQVQNAAVAIQSLLLLKGKGFHISDDAIFKGMSKAVWPARFQVIKENPLMILDGAHNPDGIRSLIRTLKEYFPGKKFIFLTGILKDKKWETMLRLIAKESRKIIFTRPMTVRSIPPSDLAIFMKKLLPEIEIEAVEDPVEAFKIFSNSFDGNPMFICGSLYLAGDILRILKYRKK